MEKSNTNSQIKEKNNKIMLNQIPKWVCKGMVEISLIQIIGFILIVAYGAIMKVDYIQLIPTLSTSGMLTIGIGVLAIAVSAWVGLNIYISISREEAVELEKKVQKFEEKAEDFERLENGQKEKVWSEFCASFEGSRYIIDRYFQYLFSKFNFKMLKPDMIYYLIYANKEFKGITILYENEKHKDCLSGYRDVLDLFYSISKRIEDDELLQKNKEGKWLEFFLACRRADLMFYHCASSLRASSEKIDAEDMMEVVAAWKKIEIEFSELKDAYEDEKSVRAYILNTIGYTYDLKNQNKVDSSDEDLECAIKYMTEAVGLLKAGKDWKTSKARYLRNLGLTYERKKEYEKAQEFYKQSLLEDGSDYKSWVAAGAITIKVFEMEMCFSKKDKIFPELSREKFIEKHDEFIQALEYCRISKEICPSFIDPYNKMIQLHTYLFLGNPENYMGINEVNGYIEILKIFGATKRLGTLFAIRNFYEAVNNISEADDWNEKIGTIAPNNEDYKNAKKLYCKKLERESKF